MLLSASGLFNARSLYACLPSVFSDAPGEFSLLWEHSWKSQRLVRTSSSAGMDWKGVGRTPRHGSPIHSRSRLAQTRRATMLDGSMIPGNSLVFGPGGQASIIAPQDNGDGPQMASQGSDQFPQGVPDIGTDSTIAANTMSPVCL